MNTTIKLLRDRCRGKSGATRGSLFAEEYTILDGDLTGFARFILDETPPVIMLRCRDSVHERLQKTVHSISVSKRIHWDTHGWIWVDVAFDGSIVEDELLFLVDDSYQITYDGLYDFQKVRLSVLMRNLKPLELFSELLLIYGLSHGHEEIEALSRQALLLKTNKAIESQLEIGQTKIGGQPDLPDGIKWPQFKDGKPLAFLAQINLGDVAAVTELSALPKTGIIYFFSVFGWQVAGDSDPQLPAEKYTNNWTKILYYQGDKITLRRRCPPSSVNLFSATQVEFIPITCLPTHTEEPDVAKLDWNLEVKNKYDDSVSAYNDVCSHQLENPPRNLLLGYADYEQDFVNEVADDNLQLLFQLASDANAGMRWGDEGFIYFWITPQDLSRQNFERVFTDYQCG